MSIKLTSTQKKSRQAGFQLLDTFLARRDSVKLRGLTADMVAALGPKFNARWRKLAESSARWVMKRHGFGTVVGVAFIGDDLAFVKGDRACKVTLRESAYLSSVIEGLNLSDGCWDGAAMIKWLRLIAAALPSK